MKKAILLILTVLTNVWLLNAQGTWTQKADFAGSTRMGAVGFCIGTKCYMGTGVYGTGSPGGGPPLFKDFWEWDSATNTWTQKADFWGGIRSFAMAFTIGNKGYIMGGRSNTQSSYNDLWEYDPYNNTWTQKASLPGSSRSDATGFSIGTKGYICVGGGDSYMLSDFWEWDQSTDTWTRKADYAGGPRISAIAFSIGNKGYVGAGSDNNTRYKDFWEWDRGTNVWTRKVDLPIGAGVGFAIGSKGYVGINCSNDTLWQWDPSTNLWTFTTNFPGTPCGDMGFSNGIKAYVGIGGGYWRNEFWEFDLSGTMQIKEEQVVSSMRIFPNPFLNEITITYTSDVADKLFVTIKNTLGQIVYTDNETHFSGAYNKTINLGANAKGNYFVEIICGKDFKVTKIVLE